MNFSTRFRDFAKAISGIQLYDQSNDSDVEWRGTNGAGHTYGTEVRPGEKDAQDMRVAIPTWKKVKVSASGIVSGIGQGNVFGGLSYVSGTTPTAIAYDASSADAANLLWSAAANVVDKVPVGPLGKAVDTFTFGVELTTGLYLTLAGTSPVLWVWYR